MFDIWGSFSKHYPRLSDWIAKWNLAALMLAGVGLEEAREYAIALVLLILGACSVAFSSFHWKGINDFPRLTKVSRLIIFVFGLALLPVCLLWILNAKSENSWSRLLTPKVHEISKPKSANHSEKSTEMETKMFQVYPPMPDDIKKYLEQRSASSARSTPNSFEEKSTETIIKRNESTKYPPDVSRAKKKHKLIPRVNSILISVRD